MSAPELSGNARRLLFALLEEGDPRPRNIRNLAKRLTLTMALTAVAFRELERRGLATTASASDVWVITLDCAQVVVESLR